MPKPETPSNPFDGCVYVLMRQDTQYPLSVAKHYGMALSLAGELGATGIERIGEGVWQGKLPNGLYAWIYRMGVRGS